MDFIKEKEVGVYTLRDSYIVFNCEAPVFSKDFTKVPDGPVIGILDGLVLNRAPLTMDSVLNCSDLSSIWPNSQWTYGCGGSRLRPSQTEMSKLLVSEGGQVPSEVEFFVIGSSSIRHRSRPSVICNSGFKVNFMYVEIVSDDSVTLTAGLEADLIMTKKIGKECLIIRDISTAALLNEVECDICPLNQNVALILLDRRTDVTYVSDPRIQVVFYDRDSSKCFRRTTMASTSLDSVRRKLLEFYKGGEDE